MLTLLTFALLFLGRAQSEDWTGFEDAGTEGVIITSENVIQVNEELGESTLVILTSDESEKPRFSGNDLFPKDFGADFEKNSNGKWTIKISRSPDYEKIVSSVYRPQIQTSDGSKKQDVVVKLFNVDDNEPEFIVDSARCSVNESFVGSVQECKYRVTDADGCANTIQFDVTFTGQGDQPGFELIHEKPAEDYPDCLQKTPSVVSESNVFLNVADDFLDYENTYNYYLEVNYQTHAEGPLQKSSASDARDCSHSIFEHTCLLKTAVPLPCKSLLVSERCASKVQIKKYVKLHLQKKLSIDRYLHKKSLQITVDVNDLPDTPPTWSSYPSTVPIDEGETKQFQIRARDGDARINAKICYTLEVQGDVNDEEKNYFHKTEDQDSAYISIDKIDRDLYQHNTYSLHIVAYECDDTKSEVTADISVSVKDLNNKQPVICVENAPDENSCHFYEKVQIEENTFFTFDKLIRVYDMDEGNKGTFHVTLFDDSGNKWDEAFMVTPAQAYQDANFILTVKDPTKLDYENENWRQITITVVATEVEDPSHKDQMSISIEVTNANDENPVFDDNSLKVSMKENMKKGDVLATLKATDKDGDDDLITFELVQAKGLTIEPETGIITVTQESYLNYEMQPEVNLQVYAMDSMGGINHKTYGTLVITVIDVDDVQPEITLGSDAVSINEMEPTSTPIEVTITASDVDTEASLEFSIDWDSTVARKDGIPVADKEVYRDYCIIRGSKVQDQEWTANLEVAKQLSWNDVDTIKLKVVVTDKNTDPSAIANKDNSAILTVSIVDVNDHQPVFDEGVCDKTRSFYESSKSDVLISNGRLHATDADGPGNNEINYTISPSDDYVVIDPESGVLSTGPKPYDADCENCQLLVYTVTATNPGGPNEGKTDCQVTINVLDVNDNTPKITVDTEKVEISESDTTGKLITNIFATDADYSDDFSTVEFEISTSGNSGSKNYFGLNDNGDGSVQLVVKIANNGFDYDEGDKAFDVIVIARDNPQNPDDQNTATATIHVDILDVNDNAPTFTPLDKPNECFFTVPENRDQFLTDPEAIYAQDKDSGDNGWVSYSITNVTCIPNFNEKCLTDDEALELFDIRGNKDSTQPNVKVAIGAKKSLLTLFGHYYIDIVASDHGDEPLSSDPMRYLGCIYDVNDHDPAIVYPSVDSLFITESNNELVQYDGTEIPLFEATDEDYEDNGLVTFTIDEKDSPFQLKGQGRNKAKFMLSDGSSFDDLAANYDLTIKACDNAPDTDQRCSKRALNLQKYSSKPEEPTFPKQQMDCPFTEGDAGLEQNCQLPTATDINNNGRPPGMPEQKIYYYITSGNDDEFFSLDPELGLLTLKSTLEYTEETKSLELIIQTSNTDDANKLPHAGSDSLLDVTVKVIDTNDKSPQFERKSYAVTASSNAVVVTVKALDPDTGIHDTVTYEIKLGSVDTSHLQDNQPANPDSVFAVDPDSGSVTMSFAQAAVTTGYFTFKVVAKDQAGHTDECDVTVYLVPDSYKYRLTFHNSANEVTDHLNDVTNLLSEYFKSKCIVEIVLVDGTKAADVITNTNVFFMNEDGTPRPLSEFQSVTGNVTKMWDLKTEMLEKYGLNLDNLANPSDNPGEPIDDGIGQGVLIGVCVVLGVILVAMIGLHIYRTRSLRKLVNDLTKATAPEYEKKDNVTLPNTNLHANIGSNPVYKVDIDDKELDNVSVASSNDSSLVGMEDNPEFQEFYSRVVLQSGNKSGFIDDETLKENPQLSAITTDNDNDYY